VTFNKAILCHGNLFPDDVTVKRTDPNTLLSLSNLSDVIKNDIEKIIEHVTVMDSKFNELLCSSNSFVQLCSTADSQSIQQIVNAVQSPIQQVITTIQPLRQTNGMGLRLY
jgi:hypothetical protein